eukprot:3732455-Prymnesium_polylepis.1
MNAGSRASRRVTRIMNAGSRQREVETVRHAAARQSTGRRHLEIVVVGGADRAQAEDFEQRHDARERDRAGRDRVVEQRVELIVIAVHGRRRLERLELSAASLANKMQARASSDLMRARL